MERRMMQRDVLSMMRRVVQMEGGYRIQWRPQRRIDSSEGTMRCVALGHGHRGTARVARRPRDNGPAGA